MNDFIGSRFVIASAASVAATRLTATWQSMQRWHANMDCHVATLLAVTMVVYGSFAVLNRN